MFVSFSYVDLGTFNITFNVPFILDKLTLVTLRMESLKDGEVKQCFEVCLQLVTLVLVASRSTLFVMSNVVT